MSELTPKTTSISLRIGALPSPFFIFKRLFDIIFSLIALPFVGLTALILKIVYLLSGDSAPIFYHQTRIGKEGKEFMLHKFRTMVPNSAELLEEILKDEARRIEWHKYHKLDNDPRITKLGKFLRKTSLDELPQFLNIFLGDMSIIGPRPLVDDEIDAYGDDQKKLLSLRPGLTGWWACNGRSCTTDTKRRELELFYCNNASFRLDCKCFFLTIVKVFKGDGAK